MKIEKSQIWLSQWKLQRREPFREEIDEKRNDSDATEHSN